MILALVSCIFSLSSIATAQTADTIYHNGSIITIDESAPEAGAVAILDGKIIAVGAKIDVLKTKGDATTFVDLKGRTMLPGFVDAHGHVMGGGLQALSANLLAPPDGEVTNIASLQQTLKDWMAENKKAVEKIMQMMMMPMDGPPGGLIPDEDFGGEESTEPEDPGDDLFGE